MSAAFDFVTLLALVLLVLLPADQRAPGIVIGALWACILALIGILMARGALAVLA